MRSRTTALALATALVATASPNRGLVPFAFEPLPLGSIKPLGWLKDQLQLMAGGLAGHEMDFYRYVAHSTWIGQWEEYSILNEAFPYWFNGLVPLAYSIDDERLKEQVHSSVGFVLDHQHADGWIGPASETPNNRMFWAREPFFLGLTLLAEANSTWRPRIVDAMHKFNTLANSMLKNNYTGLLWQQSSGPNMTADTFGWGLARTQDLMVPLQWLYDYYPGDEKQSQMLLENMRFLHQGGWKWEDWYNPTYYFGHHLEDDLYTLPAKFTNDMFWFEHGVNVGEGLKATAVVRRFTYNDSLIQTSLDGVNWTMTYHGSSSGTVLGDERIDGIAPMTGSETCTTVETMYSLSYLYQTLGNNYYADRAELAAFNSLTSKITSDWWAHQYMEQTNQPYCENLTETPFFDVNSWGQTYGLEPNYPCCTVNHPQGWPKFTANSWAKKGNGLAHLLLSPSTATAELDAGSATVQCETAYPFLDTLRYTVSASGAMTLHLRVPAWADLTTASISLNNHTPSTLNPNPETGMHSLDLPKGHSHITYNLPTTLRTVPRANETLAIYIGALLYALSIPHTTTSTLPKPFYDPGTYYPASYAPPQSRDYQYTNSSAWNYAIDPSTLTYHSISNVTDPNYQLANPIFEPGGPPGYVTAKACLIEWPLFKGSVPGYAPMGEARKCVGGVEEVRLISYGAAKTHMAELAVIDLSGMMGGVVEQGG